MAAALLTRHLHGAGVPAEVRSVGTIPTGRPARAEVVAVLAERGIDISGHVSRPLEARLVGEADVVLGMAREHVREAVVMVPDAWSNSFTLKELVRRGEARPRQGEPLDRWLDGLGAGRDVGELLGASRDDDVEDPVGQPLGAFRQTCLTLDTLVAHLVRIAWPRRS
jgi:protein-tyrosine phosphatase